jgi:hypothetical protein
MTDRTRRKTWTAAALLLIAMGGLTACNLFGNQATPLPTEPPPPTETPLPALPTLTPTPTTVVLPTPTPTKVVEATSANPTLTPTTQAPAKTEESAADAPDGGAPQAVSYTIQKAPAMGDAIVNGSFEDGFAENGVGLGWTAFDNGGVGLRTYLEELQPSHVSHDDRAQLMQLTGVGNVDRYIGIYQTVDVMAGETYTLSLHGIIRTSDADDDNVHYGHRLQWAIDYEGKGDWREIKEWFDTGWNDIPLDQDGPTMNTISLPIEAESDQLTLFIRGWTKWPTQPIAKFYVDGVFLLGQVAGEETVVKVAPAAEGSAEGMPTTGSAAAWLPIAGVLFIIGFALWEIRKVRKPAA